MSRISQLKRWLLEPESPGVGIEFRPGQILVARFGDQDRNELDLCLKAPVPSGVIEFSMLTPNLKEPDALRAFLGKLIEEAGVRSHRIGLTLPDILARISIQELPEVPRSKKEAEELLRFRLKKSLPFEAAGARLSFQLMTGSPPTYLTGIMHEEVVNQYEALLEGLGFHVGMIETSSLSLLKLWQPVVADTLLPEQDYFFLNVEETYFTLSLIRRRQEPVLIRTVGHRSPPPEREPGHDYQVENLLRELLPTLIYYREKLDGKTLARVFYRSLRPDLGDLRALLEEQFEVPAEPFDLARAVRIGSNLKVDEPLASEAGAAAGVARGKAA